MRIAVAGVIAAVVAAVVAAGCAGVRTEPDGAWTACGNVARPTTVQVRRDPMWVPLPPAHPSVAAVQRLFRDFCVIAGHPDESGGGGSCACPRAPSPDYHGVFYAGARQLAAFGYDASYLALSVGSAQMQTALYGPASALAPSLSTDFAAVLGISPESVYNPPRQPPPPPPRLTAASTAAVAGRSGPIAVISGTARCRGGEQAMLDISLYEAGGQNGGYKVPIACDDHRQDWTATVRASFPASPQGTHWTAPGHGDLLVEVSSPAGLLDFSTRWPGKPVTRDIRFVVTRYASQRTR